MKILKQSKLFLISIYYTPFKNLFYRFIFLLKRKVYQKIFQNKKTPFKPINEIQINKKINSIWELDKNKNFTKVDGGYNFTFLNEKHFFHEPFDWHPAYLNKGTRLWKLNLHYFEWISGITDDDMIYFIKDWISKNNPYQKNYWMDSWNSYALSIRIVSWINEFSRRKINLTKEDLSLINQSIFQQASFLMKNLELDIGGNHIIKNIKALYFAGNYLNVEHSSKWIKKANYLLDKELDKQILDDGFHFELSPAYHCQVFADLLDCYTLVNSKSLRKKLKKKLNKMISVIHSFTHPDHKISLFNDGGLNMAKSPQKLITAFRILFPDFKMKKAKKDFKDAGYLIAQNNLYHLIYNYGNAAADELPAHGHGDIFSFELSVNNERVIVDQGVYEYNNTIKRKISRSTLFHNTLCIDNKDQCEFWSSFRMARRARVKIKELIRKNNIVIFKGSHDGFTFLKGKPVHERKITCSENNIKIVDKVSSAKSHYVQSSLLIHPQIDVKRINQKEIALIGSNFSIDIKTDNAIIKEENAVWWPDFGVEEQTKRINFQHYSSIDQNEFNIAIKENK